MGKTYRGKKRDRFAKHGHKGHDRLEGFDDYFDKRRPRGRLQWNGNSFRGYDNDRGQDFSSGFWDG